MSALVRRIPWLCARHQATLRLREFSSFSRQPYCYRTPPSSAVWRPVSSILLTRTVLTKSSVSNILQRTVSTKPPTKKNTKWTKLFQPAKRTAFTLVRITDNFIIKYGVFANMFIAASLLTLGDFVAQVIEHKYFHQGTEWKLDVVRLFRSCVAGAFCGSFANYWYLYLARCFGEGGVRVAAKKTFVDTIIGAPLSFLLYFGICAYMQDGNFSKLGHELKTAGLISWLIDCATGVPWQMMNFYYIPHRFRVLFLETYLLFLGVVLSFLRNKFRED